MNSFQEQLFKDLEVLVANTDTSFYRGEFMLDGKRYWIYNYRLASFTQFLQPNAMNARGVMYEVDENGNAVRLAALPMAKFFNLNENPLTMNLNTSHSNIESITYKADGSLISTFIHNDELFVKSKGSLFSDQAVAAAKFLDRPENADLKEHLEAITKWGFTVDMEYVAPTNRIVLGYEKENLIVLSIRDINDGRMVLKSEIDGSHGYLTMHFSYSKILDHWVESVGIVDNFVDSVPTMEGIEGFVVRLKDGTAFKTKTDWYVVLHKTKDSINSPRKLFECVIQETTDDLRQLFRDDPVAMQQILDMENRVVPKFAHMTQTVEHYYEENEHLSRKDYAIKGQTIDDGFFSLKMTKYTGKPVDYKEFAIKHPELFGVKEDAVNEAVSEE
jgi:T4 RnlA family RNA ligase